MKNSTIVKLVCLITCLTASITSVMGQVQNPRTLPVEWKDYGIGDPYILKFRGKFYLYCSTRDDTTGIKCWSSWDLASWNYEGFCVSGSTAISQAAYAPEVIYWNGKFYLYTSPAGQGHYIFQSDYPTGPFTVYGGNNGRSIDGSVFIDDNNQFYFTYASTQILGATMSWPLAIDGPQVLTGASLLGQWTEGSTVFKRNGVYYMTYTGNHLFSPGYRVSYGTATHPLGPYSQKPPSPILLNTEDSIVGLGHSGSFIGPDLDTWYIAYHNLINVYPKRKLNIDPMGFNGDKLVVYGPTTWTQRTPKLPDFYDRFNRTSIGSRWINVGGGNWGLYNQELMWQNSTNLLQWHRQVTDSSTAANYTAEFNLKEVGRGDNSARCGAVFSYLNENTFGYAVLSSFDNTLETEIKVNGVSSGKQIVNLLPGWDHQDWHMIRVEKKGTKFKIFFDNMLKSEHTVAGIGGGKIGVTTYRDHADFGYTAYTNQVDGSGIFSFYKPIPGTIEAVHYNQGPEGVAYHDLTPGNTGGEYRSDGVDITGCPGCGMKIGWNQSGEWYKYNVNIQSAGPYHLGFRYTTPGTGCQVRIWVDNTDVSGVVSLPSTGGWNDWTTKIIKNLALPAGEHTIRVETVTGEFDFYTLQFERGFTGTISGSDNFNGSFSPSWNYFNGAWSIVADPSPSTNSRTRVPAYGKRVMGNSGWSDYTVEADVEYKTSGNAGILFRVQNPAVGGAANDDMLGSDFLQGYYAGIENGGIVLGKHNYDWTTLAYQSRTFTAGMHKIRAVLSGANIKIYVDDMITPVFNHTDNNAFLCGRAGLRAHASDARFDNFLVSGTGLMSSPSTLETAPLFALAPNPADGQTVLHYTPATTETTTILLYDFHGRTIRKIYDGNLPAGSVNQFIIPRGNLAAGTYFLRLKTKSGSRQEKIIFR